MSESVLAGSAMRSSQWTSSGESPRSGIIVITALEMLTMVETVCFSPLKFRYLCVGVAFSFFNVSRGNLCTISEWQSCQVGCE